MKKILGSMLSYYKEYIQEKLGEEAFRKVLEAMNDEECKSTFRGVIISNKAYDLKNHIEFITAIEKTLGRDELKNATYYNAEKGVKGFYGMLMKFISFERVANNSDKMWKKVFYEGDLSINEENEDKIVAILGNYETSDIHHTAATLWIERLFQLIKKKEFKSKFIRIDEKTTKYIFSV